MATKVNKHTDTIKKVEQEVSKIKNEAQKKALAEIKKAKKKFQDASKKVEKYIKDNPEKATLISAGVGAAFGAMLSMLFRKKR